MTTESNVPNLDAMSADDLMTFWVTYQRGRGAKALFPQGGKSTRTATGDLANYASNKATAMTCRLRGEWLTARMYEDIADRIYNGLPDFAKW